MKYREWMKIASGEYGRVRDLLAELDADDWHRATDCPGWTVRDIVAHLVGAAEATASVREQMRQQREGKSGQGDGDRMAAVNALQIVERESLSSADLCAALADASDRGLKARSRIPAPMRWPRFPFPPPLGWASLGYLNGPIYTRDVWMHRIDIARATDRELVLSADHDGRIVADLMAQWGANKRAGVHLSGPAGGHFGVGEAQTHDAIEFCRALAGRGSISGLAPAIELF